MTTALIALQPLLGLATLLALAWVISENRRRFPLYTVLVGLAIQFGLALLLLKLPGSQIFFAWFGAAVQALQQATEAGTTFVFGFLGGGALPFEESSPGSSFVLVFRVLPMVIFVSALAAVLYHFRILPWVVRGFAFALSKALRLSGAASFATAANVFIGMVEAPLLVRPYFEKMSRSEVFVVMTGGMATIAGTVFVLFAAFLSDLVPNAAGHLLTASIISAPAAILIARVMIPPTAEEEEAEKSGKQNVQLERLYESAMDALTRGTADGLRLLAYIVGMLIVLVALVELINITLIFAFGSELCGGPITLQRLLGWALAPAVWLLGIPWSEAITAGQLLGTKVVLNELVAYVQMSGLTEGALSERSAVIMTYTLCGFANFGSVGIMLGGLGALVPERRVEIGQLGVKSIIAGNMATAMTGAIAGLLFW